MNLQCDLTRSLALRILYRNAKYPVDRSPDAIADGEDFVTIPFSWLHRPLRPIIPVQLPATVLVVELTPYPSSYVSLVSMRLAVIVDRLRAKLDSGVATVRRQLHIHRKVKIAHGHIGPEKLVLRHWLLRMPHNRALLH